MENELIELFEDANREFLRNNKELFVIEISEQTLCGALMIEFHEVIKQRNLTGYYVDVEYNRHIIDEITVEKKTAQGPIKMHLGIRSDLIVHSRGKMNRDNLIALEMKKACKNDKKKKADRDRLMALTASPGIIEVPSDLEKILVFGYELGIFYDVDLEKAIINVEFYQAGKKSGERQYKLCDY